MQNASAGDEEVLMREFEWGNLEKLFPSGAGTFSSYSWEPETLKNITKSLQANSLLKHFSQSRIGTSKAPKKSLGNSKALGKHWYGEMGSRSASATFS